VVDLDVDAGDRQPGRVQDPGAARAVLDAHGSLGDQFVETPAVERAGDGLVVADRPQPLAPAERLVGLREGRGELVGVGDVRRPHER
jgi:hypothetical protein